MTYSTKKMQCQFCALNAKEVDYKNVDLLKKFVDTHARISKKRNSGTCASHQRKVSTAIKHARFMALLPFVAN